MLFETNFICNFCVEMLELPRKYNSPYLSPHISKWDLGLSMGWAARPHAR